MSFQGSNPDVISNIIKKPLRRFYLACMYTFSDKIKNSLWIMSGSGYHDDRLSPSVLRLQVLKMYSLLEAASNFSDFFFRFHFHGLKSLPKAENLDLVRSAGGVRAPDPRLFVRTAEPFCFFAATKHSKCHSNW